jgi:hypothetical protein
MRPMRCLTYDTYWDADNPPLSPPCLCANGTQQHRELVIRIPEINDPAPTTAQDIVDHVELMGTTPPGLAFMSRGPLPADYRGLAVQSWLAARAG